MGSFGRMLLWAYNSRFDTHFMRGITFTESLVRINNTANHKSVGIMHISRHFDRDNLPLGFRWASEKFIDVAVDIPSNVDCLQQYADLGRELAKPEHCDLAILEPRTFMRLTRPMLKSQYWKPTTEQTRATDHEEVEDNREK